MAEGGEAFLCRKSLADAAADYAWQTDPELARLTVTVPLTASFAGYLSEYDSQLCHDHPLKRQFAIKTGDGRHIGNCACYGIDESKGEAEIGILIGDRRYWNKGYGTNAIICLVNYVFNQINCVRIRLKTLESNKRAQRCFCKCGFTICGNITSSGNNFVIMELLVSRWRQINKDGYLQLHQLAAPEKL